MKTIVLSKEYLEIQNYSEEMEHLENKYGLPDGRLYLVYCDEELAGCIGLRKIDSQNCEMKRLYVRPQFRGRKIGNLLVEKIIDDAKKIGYSHMLLDTLPFLRSAIHMYKKYGFYEISSYNDSPMDTSIYMKLDFINLNLSGCPSSGQPDSNFQNRIPASYWRHHPAANQKRFPAFSLFG